MHEYSPYLQKIADNYYQYYFHHQLHCKLYYDDHYKNIAGMFVQPHKNTSQEPHININPNNVKDYNEALALGVIKHELVHYYLWRTKDPHGCGHTPRFKHISKKIGGGGTYMPWSMKYRWCRKRARETLQMYFCGGNIYIHKYYYRLHYLDFMKTNKQGFVTKRYKCKIYHLGQCLRSQRTTMLNLLYSVLDKNLRKSDKDITHNLRITVNKYHQKHNDI